MHPAQRFLLPSLLLATFLGWVGNAVVVQLRREHRTSRRRRRS